jgi:hypothetical protein
MAASVLNSIVLRLVRNIYVFLNGERVHIGADGDDRTGLATFEKGDNPVLANSGLHVIQPETPQPLRNHSGSSLLAIGKLRMHMKVASLCDHCRTHPIHDLRYFLVALNQPRAGRKQDYEQEK